MFKSLALLLAVPAAYAYSIHLFPPSEFERTPSEGLSARMEVESLVIEDFEDDQLAEGLGTTLGQGTNLAATASVWDGSSGSKEVNAALFDFDLPGVRFFGVGLSDNDGGAETLSVNGGWHINLNSFPNHNANGQGKAYYLVVMAGPNDPDLRTVSIANGFSIVFDHVVFGRTEASAPLSPVPRTSEIERAEPEWRIRNMAERVRQQQRSERVAATQRGLREGELIVNGGFDQLETEHDNGLRGQFGEAMFAQGSTGLKGWTILNAVVGLRDSPHSPAGIPILELGPRDAPGAISQRIQTKPGEEYELSFLAAGGRNTQIQASVAGRKETIDCPDPSDFKRVKILFRASDAETEILISGMGNQGFGPMIDDVSVVPVKAE